MPRIVYVGGAARSGSTLVGEILGAQPGALNVGELSLFWRDAARGGVCACGSPIADCGLWGEVLRRVEADLGVRRQDYASLARTRSTLASLKHGPRMLRMLRRKGTRWNAEQRRLVEATSSLVSHALTVSGAHVAVDSSKGVPGMLFHLLDRTAQLRLVHLLRDPRAVAASFQRSLGLVRGNAESLPPGTTAAVSAMRWNRANLSVAAGSRLASVSTRVSYEHLMADPVNVSSALAAFAGLSFDPATVHGRVLTVPDVSHAAVGNPVRRIDGDRELWLDDRWRSELSQQDRRLVLALTWPTRALLGHRGRSR